MEKTAFYLGKSYLVFLKSGDKIEDLVDNNTLKDSEKLEWNESRQFQNQFADYQTKSFLDKYDSYSFWLQCYEELAQKQLERKEHYEILLQERIGHACISDVRVLEFLYKAYTIDYQYFISETRSFGDYFFFSLLKRVANTLSNKCFVLKESKEYGNLNEGLRIAETVIYDFSNLSSTSFDGFSDFYMKHYQSYRKV